MTGGEVGQGDHPDRLAGPEPGRNLCCKAGFPLATVEDVLSATLQGIAALTAKPGAPANISLVQANLIFSLAVTELALSRAATHPTGISLEVIRHRPDQSGISEPVVSPVGCGPFPAQTTQ